MNKIFLFFILAFAIQDGFAQSENSKMVDAKGDENVVEKKLGNLIIQTIPPVVKVEIPKMGINGNKTQDSIILEDIYTGNYDLIFRLKKKKFHCSVEVLNKKTIHLLVDVKKKKFEVKEINYNPHLPDPIPVDPNAVYVIVDDMPKFPGGMKFCQRWIAKNIRYPEDALKRKIQGLVFAAFVINKEGKAEDIEIIRSVDSSLNAEAIRVISSMPTWKPGKEKGKLAKVSYTFPIRFRMSNPIPIPVDTSAVHVIVDEMPEFPGGMIECQKWIAMNVEYPLKAMQNGVVGKVYVSFVINKDGKVESVKIIRSVDPDLDAEAVMVISNMPTWKPGRHNGKLAKVSYTFPIDFHME